MSQLSSVRPFFDLTQAERLRASLVASHDMNALRRLAGDLDAPLDTLALPEARSRNLIACAVIDHFAAKEGGIARLLAAVRAKAPAEPGLLALETEWVGLDFLPNPNLNSADLICRRFLDVPEWIGLLYGRENLLDQLTERLKESAMLALYGTGGVGKTALALALCHSLVIRSRFPGGVLWTRLGQTATVEGVLARWEEVLRLPSVEQLDKEEHRLEKRKQAIAHALGEHPMLVVLDDAWDAAVARGLLLAAPAIAHVITTRDVGVAKEAVSEALALALPPLELQPSRELLAVLAPRAWESDPAKATALADAVGGLPLALRVLGAYLSGSGRDAEEPLNFFPDQHSIALEEIADPKVRLDQAAERLGSKGTAPMRDVLALSLSGLPEEAVRAFHALGAFAPSPARFSWAAAKEVTQSDSTALAWLATRNLLDVYEGGKWLALHQVLSELAAGLATNQALAEARKRHREHYLAVIAADQDDWQRIEAIYEQSQYAAIRAPGMWLDSYEQKVGIYQVRRELWSDAVALLDRVQPHIEHKQDHSRLAGIFVRRGFVYAAVGDNRQALEQQEKGLRLYRRLRDVGGEAQALNNIGGVYDNLGEKQAALDYYQHSLTLRRQAGDRAGEASTLNNIGGVFNFMGMKQDALRCYTEALTLFRRVDDVAGEALALNNIGGVYKDLGDLRSALEFYDRALVRFHRSGKARGEAVTLNNIGGVYSALRMFQPALDHFEQALAIFRQYRDTLHEATTLNNIGKTHLDFGHTPLALENFQQALTLHRRIRNASGEATALANIGAILAAMGRTQEAIESFNQALEYRRRMKDVAGIATVLGNLARLYYGDGEITGAVKLLTEAYHTVAPYGLPEADESLAFLALILGSREATQAHLQTNEMSRPLKPDRWPSEVQEITIFQAIEMACRGNVAVLDQAYEWLGTLVLDSTLPPEDHMLAKALTAILDGERELDLSALPEEYAAAVRELLARLARTLNG